MENNLNSKLITNEEEIVLADNNSYEVSSVSTNYSEDVFVPFETWVTGQYGHASRKYYFTANASGAHINGSSGKYIITVQGSEEVTLHLYCSCTRDEIYTKTGKNFETTDMPRLEYNKDYHFLFTKAMNSNELFYVKIDYHIYSSVDGDESDGYIPVNSIEFYGEKVYTTVGEEFEMDITVNPSNASNKTLVWKSSDENVATIDCFSGYVYAVRSGETTITATSVDGNITASCTFIVINTLNGADKYITDQNIIDTIINSKNTIDVAYNMFLSGKISECQFDDIKKTAEYTADLARADFVVVNDQSDFAYQYFKNRNYENGDVSPFNRNLVYNESSPMSGLDVMIVQRGMQAIGFFNPDEDYIFGTYDLETFTAAKENNVFGNDTFLENSYRVIFNYTNKSQRTPQWLLDLQEYSFQHKKTQIALETTTLSKREVIIKKGGPSKIYDGRADLLGDRSTYSEIWEVKHYNSQNLQLGNTQLSRYIAAATENDQDFSKPLRRGYDFNTFYIEYTDNTCLEISSTSVAGLVFYREIPIPNPAPSFVPVVFPDNVKEYEYKMEKLPLKDGLVVVSVVCILGVLYVKFPQVLVPLTSFLSGFADKHRILLET